MWQRRQCMDERRDGRKQFSSAEGAIVAEGQYSGKADSIGI